jgi:hypothetical protein
MAFTAGSPFPQLYVLSRAVSRAVESGGLETSNADGFGWPGEARLPSQTDFAFCESARPK